MTLYFKVGDSMGNKETNYKKILLGLGLALGMILTATIIAVATFFMSIPIKHSSESPERDFATESSPGFNPVGTPENELRNSASSQLRDPFMPPAIAWSNIIPVSPEPEYIKEKTAKVTVTGARPSPNIKKTKETPVKSSKNFYQGQRSSSMVLTASPEPVDPNTPEFKETLILPGLSQNNTKDVTDKNAGNGIRVSYKVKKGEALYHISRKFGVSRESIAKENNLSPTTDKLPEGKILIIPIPNTHLYQLKANETLWRIANRYGTTVELLQEINDIQDLNKLKPGQIIILPVSAGKN